MNPETTPETRCAYCDAILPNGLNEEPNPATDDDEAWAELAAAHNPDCEWIATRAHRINL